jgi:hypothetical protein
MATARPALQSSADAVSGGRRFAPRPEGGGNPLVQRMGLQEVLDAEKEKVPETTDIAGSESESALAGHVRLAWNRNKLAKERIGLKLLSCLRARRGIYSAQELAMIESLGGGNIVWHDLTEVKCRAASAWIREIVLPVGEQPWGVDPTPMPDLPPQIKKAVVNKALKKAQQTMQQIVQGGGEPLEPGEFRDLVLEIGEKLRDEAEATFVTIAGKRAKRMEKQIDDRLTQGGYASAMDDFVEDFVTYPAAILKGPYYARHKRLSWGTGFKPVVSNDAAQTWERVSPFDAFPAPSARDCQTGDFIERVRFQRNDLWDLKGLPGYRDDQIDEALRNYTDGHLEGWLWTESERQRLEQETLYMWLSPPGVIDALNFWGSVPGWKLKSWGVTGDLEDTRDYECNVLLCGSYVLYAALNPDPLHQRPYRKACYDPIPGSFWGRSIPELAGTSQKMCNALACAMANNWAIASGPMGWIHNDRLADGEQSLEMFPWKMFQLKSDSTQGVNPGVGFFQPNDNSEKLMAALEKWELKADDSTGIPRYTYGNERAGGSADTASGLSMLMNNAAKGLRRAINNIDTNVIAPTIGDTFTNEMLYNPDMSIKGDSIVVPRGAAAILIRESMQQRRLQFLTLVTNPMLAKILGEKALLSVLREVASVMELPEDTVPTTEDMEQRMQAEAQAMQQQQQGMLQQQMQIEDAREQRVTQRETQKQEAALVGDIVKQAVSARLAPKPVMGKKPGGS